MFNILKKKISISIKFINARISSLIIFFYLYPNLFLAFLQFSFAFLLSTAFNYSQLLRENKIKEQLPEVFGIAVTSFSEFAMIQLFFYLFFFFIFIIFLFFQDITLS